MDQPTQELHIGRADRSKASRDDRFARKAESRSRRRQPRPWRPRPDKGSHWTRGHGDARAMTVAGLDQDAASAPQIAKPRAGTKQCRLHAVRSQSLVPHWYPPRGSPRVRPTKNPAVSGAFVDSG